MKSLAFSLKPAMKQFSKNREGIINILLLIKKKIDRDQYMRAMRF